MTLPNYADGLSDSPLLDWAYTIGGSIPNAVFRDQDYVSAILKNDMMASPNWNLLHTLIFLPLQLLGLIPGTALFNGIFQLMANAITGNPFTSWLGGMGDIGGILSDVDSFFASLLASLTDLFDSFWELVDGVVGGAGDVGDAVSTFLNLFANLGSLFTGGGGGGVDLTQSIGTFDPTQIMFTAPVQAAQNLLDGFVSYLGGLAGSFFSIFDYQNIAGTVSSVITTVSAAVASLQQVAEYPALGGASFFFDFSGFF